MSIVVLSVGVVVVLQAFARVSHATLVAEQRALSYMLASVKMAEFETAFREQGELPEEDEGAWRVGRQQFTWTMVSSVVPGDPQAILAALTVQWTYGLRSGDYRVETVLRLLATS